MKSRLLGACCVLMLSSLSVHAVSYQIIDIVQGNAPDINNSRQVVGRGGGGIGAFIYENGTVTSIPAQSPISRTLRGNGINEHG